MRAGASDRATGRACIFGSACLLAVALGSAPAPRAHARARHFRARFRTDTLELQKPGVLETALEAGAIYGDGSDGDRLLAPDFEFDLGLLDWLEFDVDGAFSLLHVDQPQRTWVGEPLWTSARVDVVALEDVRTGRVFGIGLQLGPRLPTLRTPRGVGAAGLLLIGAGGRRLHFVANFGSTADRGQPVSLNYGADLTYDLATRRKWSLMGEVAGTHYFGAGPDQFFTNFGVSWQVVEAVALSLLALGGPLFAGDRLGLLAGVTSDLELW